MKNLIFIYTLLLLALPSTAEVYYQEIYYRDVELRSWNPTTRVTAVSVGTNGAFAATGTWYYALAATSAIGRTAYGPYTNVVVTNGSSVTIHWKRTGGASGYQLWRGSSTNSAFTNFVLVGNVTNWTDLGTNTWTAGASVWTATNVPAVVMPAGWTPVNDRQLATKKYVDDFAGVGALDDYMPSAEVTNVFLRKSDAATNYLTQAAATNYLTQAAAAADYVTKTNLSTNLTGYIQSLEQLRFAPVITNVIFSPGFNLFSVYDNIPLSNVSTNGSGDNGGNADKFIIRESNGSWTTIYLDGSRAWSASYTLKPKQVMYYYNSAATNITISFTYTNTLSELSLLMSSADWAAWYYWIKNWLSGGLLNDVGPLTVTGAVVASSTITAGGGFAGNLNSGTISSNVVLPGSVATDAEVIALLTPYIPWSAFTQAFHAISASNISEQALNVRSNKIIVGEHTNSMTWLEFAAFIAGPDSNLVGASRAYVSIGRSKGMDVPRAMRFNASTSQWIEHGVGPSATTNVMLTTGNTSMSQYTLYAEWASMLTNTVRVFPGVVTSGQVGVWNVWYTDGTNTWQPAFPGGTTNWDKYEGRRNVF